MGVVSAAGVVIAVGGAVLSIVATVLPAPGRPLLHWEVARGLGWVVDVFVGQNHLWLALVIGAASSVAG